MRFGVARVNFPRAAIRSARYRDSGNFTVKAKYSISQSMASLIRQSGFLLSLHGRVRPVGANGVGVRLCERLPVDRDFAFKVIVW
jgi:hypothetical protein